MVFEIPPSVHEVTLLDLAVGVFVCGVCTHAKYRALAL